MISKNAKITLFGALIVALILPFGSMDMATAQTPNTTTTATPTLESVIASYETRISTLESDDAPTAETTTAVENLKLELKRLKITQQMVTISELAVELNLQDNEKLGQVSHYLADELDSTMPEPIVCTPGTPCTSETTGPNHPATIRGSNWTHAITQTQSGTSCATNQSVSGTSVTTASINGNTRTISGVFTFPDDFDKDLYNHPRRGQTTCLDYDFDNTVTKYSMISESIPGSGNVRAQVCTVSSDDTSINCNGLALGRVITVTTDATYESTSGRTTSLGSVPIWVLFS